MIDLEILREHGLTEENLKKWLSTNPLFWKTKDPAEEKRKELWNRMRSRIQEGMSRNFMDYRIYHALDKAWELPFRQLSPTLLGDFLERDPNDDSVYKMLTDLGLTNMISQEVDTRTGKPVGKKTFNLPIFFEIFVPLVRSYVTIRWAKIMNDRRLTPFFEYTPAKMTTPNKLRCEVITDRVEVMSNQYGYYDVTKQSVLKMLHYSWCLQFPKEEWHSEKQIRYADEADVENGLADNAGEEIEVTSREGLRYHHPHPTRFFRDLNHPAYTYNYGSGAEFAGYWNIRRYRDLLDGNYWNSDQISIGPNSIVEDHKTFFASVYSACTMAVPTLPKSNSNDGNTLLAMTGGGIGDHDREKQLAYLYYGTDHLDQGVLTTEYFEKLVPADNGLGTYPHPVWFRFVVAGDNATYLYAAPLPYDPVIYYGYDADESRTINASLSLEILPFQDAVGNFLTQTILTAKQNLANITLVDQDVLEKDAIDSIKNIGETIFRKLNIFGYSGKKLIRQQSKTMEAIQSHSFPKGNTAELVNVIKTILDLLERTLVMSAHEVAQAASHEQTREEVKNIAASTSSRLQFTSTPVDIAREAWKRQIYNAVMAYGDPDFYAHIPTNVPIKKEVLEAMGFTFLDDDTHVGEHDRHRRVKIPKKKTAIDLWMLASTRDGDDRVNDSQMAQTMATLVRDLMANPVTGQAIGTEQAIQIANQIAQLAGLPRDFVLRNMAPNASAQAQQQQAQQQLQQVVKIVLDQVNAEIGKELHPLMDKTMENTKDIALIVRAMGIQQPPGNSTAPEPSK